MKVFNITLIANRLDGTEIRGGCYDYEAPGGNRAAIISAKAQLNSLGGGVVKGFTCWETGDQRNAQAYNVKDGDTATILRKLNQVTDRWQWKYT